MDRICRGLSLDSDKYKPEKTIEDINVYIQEQDKLDRILYSVISNHVFDLSPEKRGTFTTNVEKLLVFALDKENEVDKDTGKIAIKIFDHVQLSVYQIENTERITQDVFGDSIEEAKIDLNTTIKGIEREYVTILGIFAAIVLAFVGGITFTSSVLENIDKPSVFRLVIIADLVGAVLVAVIYMLISLIFTINDKEDKLVSAESYITKFNKALLIIAVITVFAWIANVGGLWHYLISIFLN